MKKIILPIMLLILFLTLGCAPGSYVEQTTVEDVLASTDPAELLFVSQVSSPTLYLRTESQPLFNFPEGKLSADKSTYAAAQPLNGMTMLLVFDAPTGQQTANYTFSRRWHLNTLSPNGEFIVMTRIPREAETAVWQEEDSWQSDIRVIETATGQVLEDMTLEGNFEVEAIDNVGSAVFMIEHIPAINPEKYRVRFYDRGASQLDPRVLRDKRSIETFMTGYAWGTVATEDGSWLMTLYMNTARDNAFVHALNLNNRWTFCINLPSRDGYGDFDKLKQYSIAVTPNNRQLIAANPAIGIVAIYSLEDFEKKHVTLFDPVDNGTVEQMQVAHVSDDGRFFYFSLHDQLWGYDLATNQLSPPMMFDEPITGIEMEADTLFVSTANQTLHGVKTAVLTTTVDTNSH